MARYIHSRGQNGDKPFITVNCATIQPILFESEFFGYEPHAFTGASPKGKKGLVDAAKGGTLFLDEITEMSLHNQAKLLRFIENQTFYRLGALKPNSADVRIIAATNRDPAKAIKDGSLRQDLFFRLQAGYISVPPLRHRKADILPLAQIHMVRIARQLDKRFIRISPEAAELLLDYDWPGNVRELLNCIGRAVFLFNDEELKAHHIEELSYRKPRKATDDGDSSRLGPVLSVEGFELPADGLDLELLITRIVEKAMAMHGGNKVKTAKYLNISRSQLYSRLKPKKESPEDNGNDDE